MIPREASRWYGSRLFLWKCCWLGRFFDNQCVVLMSRRSGPRFLGTSCNRWILPGTSRHLTSRHESEAGRAHAPIDSCASLQPAHGAGVCGVGAPLRRVLRRAASSAHGRRGGGTVSHESRDGGTRECCDAESGIQRAAVLVPGGTRPRAAGARWCVAGEGHALVVDSVCSSAWSCGKRTWI